MANENLLPLVSNIVSAHTSHNRVPSAELPLMIESIYATLAGLGKSAPVIQEKLEPAVSIRSSVKPEAITCLECGAKHKMLKRHIGTHHQLTPAEYKARWGLAADYPLVAPDYGAIRRDLAVKIGLGRKAGTKVKPAVVRKPRATKAAKAVQA